MALDATDLADEIISNFPSIWDYSDTALSNRKFLDTLSGGFITMWKAGILTPGLGPPPPGSFPHVHTITTLVPATMVAGIAALGLGPLVVPWATVIATTTATHLATPSNVTTDSQQGEVLHAHGFPSFGSATVLRDAILGGLPALGFDLSSEFSAQNDWIGAYATGLLQNLSDDAGMSLATGQGHVHILD